ncbi:MAG: RNA-binding S4 domain-containing protein [Clostridiales Family XIII bacterium]|nr:RNA-binding S4 domain-containing protein [Clostridiales Family XIII bacterium]
MRIDKFLKVSRLIKRRTVAKEAADKSRIVINGRIAKAGADVKEGDIITIAFGTSEVTVRVKALNEHVRKEDAADMYEVVE